MSLSGRLRLRVDEVTAELEKAGAYARHLEAELRAKDEDQRSRTSQGEQVARLAIELEQARSRATEQATQVEQLVAELEKARGFVEKQSLGLEQVTAELTRAGAYARSLETALQTTKDELRHAVSQASHLADVQAELERTVAATRALEEELAATTAELETRRADGYRLASALDQAALDRGHLEQAMAASGAQARALDAAATVLRRDLEASQARGFELERTVTDLRRLAADGAEYVRHLEQELQRRARDMAIRDDELSVARVHVEHTGRAIANRDSHVAQLETYIRHLESELQARAGDLADRDTALGALRAQIEATERTLIDLRGALEGQQELAAYLSRVLQLPRHRLVSAWGDAFIRRVPWLHRRLRPLAARVARRWGRSPDPH